MATVFHRDGSRYWFACYVDRDGIQRRRSTKTVDKGIATRMALEWERIEDLSRSGQVTAVQFQKVVNEVSVRVIGETMPNATIEEYFSQWLESVKHRLAANTVARYRNSVHWFLDFLKTAKSQPLRCITPRVIEQFLSHRTEAGLAPKSVILDVKIVGIALRRAEVHGIIDRNPVPAVKLPKSIGSEKGIFTPDEVQKLLGAAPNAEWKTLILLGFYLGARIGDCVLMRWENVDTDNALMVFTQKKTGGLVRVPLHLNLANHLRQLSKSSVIGYLCPDLAQRRIGGKSGLSEGFKRIVQRAGLDVMNEEGKGTRSFNKRTFHSFRHSFASALANVGVSEEVRMQLTGHSSREMHAKYTHINVEPLKKAISQLPFVA